MTLFFFHVFKMFFSSIQQSAPKHNKCLRHGITLALKNTCSLGGAFNHIVFFLCLLQTNFSQTFLHNQNKFLIFI